MRISAYADHPHEPHGSATAWPSLVLIHILLIYFTFKHKQWNYLTLKEYNEEYSSLLFALRCRSRVHWGCCCQFTAAIILTGAFAMGGLQSSPKYLHVIFFIRDIKLNPSSLYLFACLWTLGGKKIWPFIHWDQWFFSRPQMAIEQLGEAWQRDDGVCFGSLHDSLVGTWGEHW